MAKSKSPGVSKAKKILIIVLSIPLFLIGLIILGIAITLLVTPILEKIDHDKFTTLDSQMHIVYNKLKTASGGVDDWEYKAVCSPQMTGWMTTGKYNCLTSISIQKNITSVQEVNDLQTKYYPIIDSGEILNTKTALDPQLPNDFGKNFVVSSAEKRYSETKTGIECSYLIKLNQPAHTYFSDQDSYGSEIKGSTASVSVALKCEGLARKSWYQLSN